MARPDIEAYISANDREFRSAMKRVRTDARQTARQARDDFSALGAQLRGTFSGAFAGGLFAGGIVGVATGVRRLIRDVASLNDEAARSGLSLRGFQEWKAVAEDTRIPLDAMVDAFKELNIRADEFATTGKGSAAEAFGRIGMSQKEVQERLKDPSDLMLEIMRRVRELGDVAAGTRIFDELLGGTGAEQTVRLLGMTDGEIRKIIDSAHEAGRVLDEEMVKRAAEIDKEFNTLWQNFESLGKSAILNVSVGLRDGLAKDVGNIAAYLKDFYNDPNLKNFQRLMLGDPIDERVKTAFDPARGGGQDAGMVKQIIDRFGTKTETPGLSFTPTDPEADKRRDADAKAAAKQKAAIDAVIESLGLEIQTMGLSEAEREKMVQLRKANADAASEDGKYIALMVDELYREKAAHEAVEEAARKQKDGMEDLRDVTMGWIDEAINGTLDWKSVLVDVLRELDRYTRTGEGLFAAFSGGGSGGGLGSLLSGIGSALFGGFRAGGGDVSAGRVYRINEKDYLEPGRSGRVYTPDQMAGGGGPSVTYAPVYNFSGTGAEMEEFKRQAARDRQEFDSRVVNSVKNAQQRRILR